MPTSCANPFAPRRPSRSAWSSRLGNLFILPLVALSLLIGAAALSHAEDPAPKAEPTPKAEAPPKEKPKAEAEPKGKKRREKATETAKAKETDSKAETKAEVKKPEPIAVNMKVDDSAWKKASPESVADLKSIQDRVQEVAKVAIPRVVGLRVGNANGSGVIISKEGYVLTAGHVSATPDRPVDIILHNGKVVRGKSLGRNVGIDSGLVKINEGEDWDFAEMGDSDALKQGEWCIAIGHPGGYMRGRPPVVRLGRIISASERVVWTDATLVGGDSGGPLFDMNGKVIAIHSRISAPTSNNFHVPVETYRKTWDRLAAGEDWTDRQFNIGSFAGFSAEPDAKGAKVTSVAENSPATLAGFQIGDIVTKFDGAAVKNLNQILETINKKRPNDQVEIELLREGKPVKVTLTFAAGFKAAPFIGISGATNEKGVGVDAVVAGTPAANAKIQKGDVISKFDGQPVKDLESLQAVISKKKAGETADVEVLRGNEILKLKITLGLRG